MTVARSDRSIGISTKRPFKVLVSLVTLMAFTVNIFSYDLAWAARTPLELSGDGSNRAGGPGLFKELHVDTFALPEHLGHIKDSWQPQGKPVTRSPQSMIIHIQDAHCNYAAQHKISEIIEYLNKEYGVDTVNLEGGSKDYDLSLFTGIADKPVRDKAADYFVKEGLVNGAEYFAINNPGKINLWGIEDSGLYIDNLNAYREPLKHKDEVDKHIKALTRVLSSLKAQIYSPELLEFDTRYSQYKADNLELKAYLSYLVKTAQEKGINVRSFKNIYLLNQALIAEGTVDFKKANNERDDLIDRLQKRLSRNEIEELVLKTIEFKSEKISQNNFYAYLASKARSINLGLNEFPELQKYIIYVSTYDMIDKIAVMNEVDSLENRIKEVLCRNDDEIKLSGLSKNLALLKNLFNISLTPDDYRYYKANEDSFEIKNYVSFINNHTPAAKLGEEMSGLDTYRAEADRFYTCSFKRDAAFIKNIKFQAKTAKRKTHNTILITGGFHTENLHSMFKKQGISYVSIMPNFKNDTAGERQYFKLLSGEKVLKIKDALPLVLKANLAIPDQLNPAIMQAVERANLDVSKPSAMPDISAVIPKADIGAGSKTSTKPLYSTSSIAKFIFAVLKSPSTAAFVVIGALYLFLFSVANGSELGFFGKQLEFTLGMISIYLPLRAIIHVLGHAMVHKLLGAKNITFYIGRLIFSVGSEIDLRNISAGKRILKSSMGMIAEIPVIIAMLINTYLILGMQTAIFAMPWFILTSLLIGADDIHNIYRTIRETSSAKMQTLPPSAIPPSKEKRGADKILTKALLFAIAFAGTSVLANFNNEIYIPAGETTAAVSSPVPEKAGAALQSVAPEMSADDIVLVSSQQPVNAGVLGLKESGMVLINNGGPGTFAAKQLATFFPHIDLSQAKLHIKLRGLQGGEKIAVRLSDSAEHSEASNKGVVGLTPLLSTTAEEWDIPFTQFPSIDPTQAAALTFYFGAEAWIGNPLGSRVEVEALKIVFPDGKTRDLLTPWAVQHSLYRELEAAESAYAGGNYKKAEAQYGEVLSHLRELHRGGQLDMFVIESVIYRLAEGFHDLEIWKYRFQNPKINAALVLIDIVDPDPERDERLNARIADIIFANFPSSSDLGGLVRNKLSYKDEKTGEVTAVEETLSIQLQSTLRTRALILISSTIVHEDVHLSQMNRFLNRIKENLFEVSDEKEARKIESNFLAKATYTSPETWEFFVNMNLSGQPEYYDTQTQARYELMKQSAIGGIILAIIGTLWLIARNIIRNRKTAKQAHAKQEGYGESETDALPDIVFSKGLFRQLSSIRKEYSGYGTSSQKSTGEFTEKQLREAIEFSNSAECREYVKHIYDFLFAKGALTKGKDKIYSVLFVDNVFPDVNDIGTFYYDHHTKKGIIVISTDDYYENSKDWSSVWQHLCCTVLHERSHAEIADRGLEVSALEDEFMAFKSAYEGAKKFLNPSDKRKFGLLEASYKAVDIALRNKGKICSLMGIKEKDFNKLEYERISCYQNTDAELIRRDIRVVLTYKNKKMEFSIDIDNGKINNQTPTVPGVPNSLIGKLLDSNNNVITSFDIARKTGGQAILVRHNGQTLAEVPIAIDMVVDKDAILGQLTRFFDSRKTALPIPAQEMMSNLIKRVKRVDAIVALKHHKDVKGAFYENNGRYTLYLNEGILNNILAIIHELGEGALNLPEGYKYLTRHTAMRGVGKDVRNAFDLLGETGTSEAKTPGELINMLEEVMMKPNFVMSNNRSRDSPMTKSEKDLIRWNFRNGLKGKETLFGIQDFLSIIDNVKLTQDIKDLDKDLRQNASQGTPLSRAASSINSAWCNIRNIFHSFLIGAVMYIGICVAVVIVVAPFKLDHRVISKPVQVSLGQQILASSLEVIKQNNPKKYRYFVNKGIPVYFVEDNINASGLTEPIGLFKKGVKIVLPEMRLFLYEISEKADKFYEETYKLNHSSFIHRIEIINELAAILVHEIEHAEQSYEYPGIVQCLRGIAMQEYDEYFAYKAGREFSKKIGAQVTEDDFMPWREYLNRRFWTVISLFCVFLQTRKIKKRFKKSNTSTTTLSSNSLIGKLLDGNNNVITSFDIAQNANGQAILIQHNGETLAEVPLAGDTTVDKDVVLNELTRFLGSRKEALPSHAQDVIIKLIEQIENVDAIVALKHHKDVKGAFYENNGRYTLYLNEGILNNILAIIHELGEGALNLPEGYKYLTRHTAMRGVGKDVRNAFDLLGETGTSEAKTPGELINMLEEVMMKPNFVMSNNRSRDSPMTKSEKDLIRWNFNNKLRGEEGLFGIQDFLSIEGNAKLSHDIKDFDIRLKPSPLLFVLTFIGKFLSLGRLFIITFVLLSIINGALPSFAQVAQNVIPPQASNQIKPVTPEDLERMIIDISSSPTKAKSKKFLDSATPDMIKLIGFDRLPGKVQSSFILHMEDLIHEGNPKAADFLLSLIPQFTKLSKEAQIEFIDFIGSVNIETKPDIFDSLSPLIPEFDRLPKEVQIIFVRYCIYLAVEGDPKATDFLLSLVPRFGELPERIQFGFIRAMAEITHKKRDPRAADFILSLIPQFGKLSEGAQIGLLSFMSGAGNEINPEAADSLSLLIPEFDKLPETAQFFIIDRISYLVFAGDLKAIDLFLSLAPQFDKLSEKLQALFVNRVISLAIKGNPKATDLLLSLIPKFDKLSGEARKEFLRSFVDEIVLDLRNAHLDGGISDNELKKRLIKSVRDEPFLLYAAFTSRENFGNLAKIIFAELETKANESNKDIGSFILGLDPKKVLYKNFILQAANFNMLDKVILNDMALYNIMDGIFRGMSTEEAGSNATRLALFVEDVINNPNFKYQKEFQEYLRKLCDLTQGRNKSLIGSLLVVYRDDLKYISAEDMDKIGEKRNIKPDDNIPYDRILKNSRINAHIVFADKDAVEGHYDATSGFFQKRGYKSSRDEENNVVLKKENIIITLINASTEEYDIDKYLDKGYIIISRSHAGEESKVFKDQPSPKEAKGSIGLISACRSATVMGGLAAIYKGMRFIGARDTAKGSETNIVTYHYLEGLRKGIATFRELGSHVRAQMPKSVGNNYIFPGDPATEVHRLVDEGGDVEPVTEAIAKPAKPDPADANSLIGKLLDSNGNVITSFNIVQGADGKSILVQHKGETLAEVPIATGVTVDRDMVIEKFTGFIVQKYTKKRILPPHVKETVSQLISEITDIDSIVALKPHKDVKGALYQKDGNYTLYISEGILNNPIGLVHELGEGVIKFPKSYRGYRYGYRNLTRHTIMRGVGKDVRNAFDVLGAERASEAETAGDLIKTLGQVMKKEDFVMSANRSRDSPITKSEKDLIRWNFKNGLRGKEALFGIEDFLKVEDNARFTQEIRNLNKDLRQGILNIFLMRSRLETKSAQAAVGRETGRKLEKNLGVNTRILYFEDNLAEQLEKAVSQAMSTENSDKLPKIFVDCLTQDDWNAVNAFKESKRQEFPNIDDMIAVGRDFVEGQASSELPDEVKVILIGNIIMNDRRLKVDFKMSPEELLESRKGIIDFLRSNEIIDKATIADDQIDAFFNDLWKGIKALLITKINWKEFRDWKNAQDEVLRAL